MNEVGKEVPFFLSLFGAVGVIVLGRLWWILRSDDQLRKKVRADLGKQKFAVIAIQDDTSASDINAKIADTLRY